MWKRGGAVLVHEGAYLRLYAIDTGSELWRSDKVPSGSHAICINDEGDVFVVRESPPQVFVFQVRTIDFSHRHASTLRALT